jgi:hypothetical protein
MAMKSLLLVLLALFAGLAQAYCPSPTLGTPDEIRADQDSLLILTHASTKFDGRLATKYDVDRATQFARQHGIPMIYLQDDAAEANYFTEDCAPQYWLHSANGELGFEVQSSNVYVAGGHLEQCLFTTVNEVIASWAGQERRDLSLTYLMDAIYSSGELIRDSDDYAADYGMFMRVLDYGRADDAPWPKITLLETAGLIRQQDRMVDYLKRTLPNFASGFSRGYRVELYLNDDEVAVLQDPPLWDTPVLQIRFVNSALGLDPL